MLLAIDVGNTNTVFAVCDSHTVEEQWRITTDHLRTADEYASLLLVLFEKAGIAPDTIDTAILSCVVPDTIFSLRKFCERYFNVSLLIVHRDMMSFDMPVLIDHPEQLGADRLVNAIAAWERYRSSVVIVDFGTATTFDVINQDGAYVGGVIAPGINLSLDALHHAAAKLPGILIRRPENVIGTNTTTAMQSGIFYGYLGLIEGIIERIKGDMKQSPKVIATGGLARLYAPQTDAIDDVDLELTIRGLMHLHYQHMQRSYAA